MQSQPSKPKTAQVLSLNDARTQRVDLSRGTLQEAWDCYLASLALDKLKAPSRLVYKQAAREAIAALPPRPKAGDVTLWLECMMRDGRAPATCNKLLRALKAITERATLVMREGSSLALRNAFKAQRPFRLAARERRDASHDTVARLLELAATPFERLAIRFAAFYGLRRGEIMGLQPGDVRTDGGSMRITVQRTRDEHGVRERKNALNGKAHVLIVSDGETRDTTEELTSDAIRLALAHTHQRELARTWLIPWGHSHPGALMNKWRKDDRVVLPAGDAWHALRHYGATILAQSSAGVTEIQAWLGDSTQTAAQCYMGQVRGTTQGTASRILRAFDGQKGADDCSCGGGVTSDTGKLSRATPPRTKSDTSCSHEFHTTSEENP
jgi:integrase